MYYYLYRITNLLNGKVYVGVHQTESCEEDGYLGSGAALKHAQRKYGLENFRKEIIQGFNTPQEMYTAEKEFVNKEYLKKDDVYNIVEGGRGGPNGGGANRLTKAQRKSAWWHSSLGKEIAEKKVQKELDYLEKMKSLPKRDKDRNCEMSPETRKKWDDFLKKK